jgi:hypothetical protein
VQTVSGMVSCPCEERVRLTTLWSLGCAPLVGLVVGMVDGCGWVVEASTSSLLALLSSIFGKTLFFNVPLSEAMIVVP